MKTYKNLYNQIISFDNLLLASRKAQKGKRFKPYTALFNLNLERELLQIQSELHEMTYRHGKYRDFFIYDPKRRLISAAPYRDRVVHHALCNVVEPVFESTFIYDSYANRKQKGTHAAVDRFTEFARKNKYVLKCDIQKYFQSIDHDILMGIISKKIACPKTLWLIKEIVCSRIDSKYFFYFAGDNLFSPLTRDKGIPIGNLTSQFFANVYLDGFDHFVKETLRCPYIRYVDDFVVFGNSKKQLHEIKKQIDGHLSSLRLKLHQRKCRLYNGEEGINFLGYRIFPNHRLIKKQNVLHMRRKLKKLAQNYTDGQVSIKKANQSIQSWVSHASHADTYILRTRILGNVVLKRGAARNAAGRFLEQ